MPAQLLEHPAPPGFPASVARFRRALQCQARNQKLEAAREYLGALELSPGFFEAAFNLGALLQEMGQAHEAIRCYRQALQAKPDLAPAWGNLGVALRNTGCEQDAVASFREALRWNPGEPDILNNLGNTLVAQDQYPEAIACFRAALQRAPGNPGIHLNLGNALRAFGRVQEAVPSLRHAIRLRPDFAQAHWDLAFALLLQGDFLAGFREYEWRWQRPDFPGRVIPAPLWQGEDLAGRMLLVHTEQGAGDAIQFVRFVRHLRERGARVTLECPLSLAALFESAPGAPQVIVRGDPLPKFDFHIPLLSLPHRLGLENIPQEPPYLRASVSHRITLPPPRARPGPGLKVGLVWRGNPKHTNDRRRSIPLSLLEPLLAVENVAFYSLQVPPAPEFAGEAAHEPALIPLDGLLGNFADTAAVVAQMDILICADTSVAHLAGALGRNTWLLLPFAADWRWLLSRDNTPWYPTMRLFRQPAPGDWPAVICGVRDALQQSVRAFAGQITG